MVSNAYERAERGDGGWRDDVDPHCSHWLIASTVSIAQVGSKVCAAWHPPAAHIDRSGGARTSLGPYIPRSRSAPSQRKRTRDRNTAARPGRYSLSSLFSLFVCFSLMRSR
ncbi:unnamed protein product, partial [Brenthis ino]